MSECERLLAEYEALRAEITLRSLDRDVVVRQALVAQQAAHLDETRAQQRLSELREAYRADPTALCLVAAADQAEGAYEDARMAALTVSQEASATAKKALARAEADSDQLHELGLRLREARRARL
ncbi:hypothetical protein [Actinoplanes sp. NPDC051494]|uniref:hypothetical protein n=1 Tax=Actinoplanes sp. NPDC051494 TaxID=3363907 RepID=UPI00379495A5